MKVARREHLEKRHRLAHDKYIAIKTPAAPVRQVPEPLRCHPNLDVACAVLSAVADVAR